jgi:hypothetical protein
MEGRFRLAAYDSSDLEKILEAAALNVKAIERPAGLRWPSARRLRRCAKLSFHPRCVTITVIV